MNYLLGMIREKGFLIQNWGGDSLLRNRGKGKNF